MRTNDFLSYEDDHTESAFNRPKSSAPKHSSRGQFSYSRSRKRPTTHFNGMHRRRSHKWTW